MKRSISVLQMSELFQEDLSQLVEIDRSLAIFVMATYGEGDPTDNAQDFYDFLKEGTTPLDGLRYAVSCLLQITLRMIKLLAALKNMS